MINRLLRIIPIILLWLQSVLFAQNQTSADSADLELEKALAAELGVSGQNTKPDSTGIAARSAQTRSAQYSFFQNMNPNISVIGTVLGSASTMKTLNRNYDLVFQEGEFSFRAAVDPYAMGDFYIAFGRHQEPVLSPGADSTGGDEHGQEGGAGLEAEIEEAYITFLSLPFSTQLKLGKFRSKFGKINETHPHAYNFVDLPLMYDNFFGPEGLVDEGISLSWLLPNSAFFQELTFQITSGPAENASFARAENNRFLYLAHLKNFFDLNDNITLEIGLTGLTGPNSAERFNTQILATDLAFKWKPLQRNREKSFELLSEFLVSKRKNAQKDVTSFAFYGFARYQFTRRWFLGAIFDYAEYPQFDNVNRTAYSGILQFFVTEFQKLEFQYRYHKGNFFDNFSEFKIRAVFVIGAHGAHQY